VHLSALYVYPIKACRGVAVGRAELTRAGLRHDREWMVVTPTGRFLTQRELPELARVVPTLCDGVLSIDAPGFASLAVSLAPGAGGRREVEVTVWDDRCLAHDEGEQAAQWFSDVLGRSVRLVRFDPSRRRPTNAEWSRGLDGEALFSDGYPLLVLSQASLDELNGRLAQPLPVDRFRPNLVVEGCAAHAEDTWRGLQAAAMRIELVKPCTRCSVTTTNQQTGEVEGPEPLRTLRLYRWNAQLRGVTFGQNGIVAEGAGEWLERGMALQPLASA
jgi:uncharacterized protein YcbX